LELSESDLHIVYRIERTEIPTTGKIFPFIPRRIIERKLGKELDQASKTVKQNLDSS
jgi:hypothetical protein